MTLPVAGNSISMSQVNTELGRSATASISFSDPEFLALSAKAGVAGFVGSDFGVADGVAPSLGDARGRKANIFQVSGTSAWSGTAPNRGRTVGYRVPGGFGEYSGAKPSWVTMAYMSEYEAASSAANSFYVAGNDDGVGRTAGQVRGLCVGGTGVVKSSWGQGGYVDSSSGDYISEGWGNDGVTLGIAIYDNFCFVPGGTTEIIIASDG